MLYRSDWNDPAKLFQILQQLPATPNEVAENGQPPTPGMWLTIRVLLKGGWDALYDFVRTMPSHFGHGYGR